MALSGTADYNLTRDAIIRQAFENIGVAIANEPLEAEDISVAAIALNAMALAWKSHGLQLWKRGRGTVTLVASTYSYTLLPTLGSGTEKPMRILQCNRKDSDNHEIAMTRLSLDEYEYLPDKTAEGTPINFYFEPGRTSSVLRLWPAPDTAAATEYTIEYVYVAPTQDMNAGTEDVDFPNEWYDALILNLAVRLAPKYGIERYAMDTLQGLAAEALQLALDYDSEDTSMFLSPRPNWSNR